MPKEIFFRLPFLGTLFLQIQNELKFFIHKHANDKASVHIIDTFPKNEDNFHLKNRQPLLMKSGIVNKLTPSILGSENDTARLLILESLFIQEQTPDLNNNFQSSPLDDF